MTGLEIFIILLMLLNAAFAFLNLAAYYAGEGSTRVLVYAIFQVLVVVGALNILVGE